MMLVDRGAVNGFRIWWKFSMILAHFLPFHETDPGVQNETDPNGSGSETKKFIIFSYSKPVFKVKSEDQDPKQRSL